MAIVPTDRPMTSRLCQECIERITQTYPFCRSEVLYTTQFGRQVRTLVIGTGPRKLIYTAAHHANEWITATLLLKFGEEYAAAIRSDGKIFGQNARLLAAAATVYMVPMVNPDGVDLVTGVLQSGNPQFEVALILAANYPTIPFPDGWKANLLGVDLNLNYPAKWLEAREIKFSQGFTRPGPRDYVGRAPLNQIETRTLAGYTEYIDPALVLAFHTQGKVIYWQFGDYQVPGAEELAREFARVSGYELERPAPESAYAGYKDWFIQYFRRPGFTIEAGEGVNPLPLSQFDEIYRDNLGILITAIRPGGVSPLPPETRTEEETPPSPGPVPEDSTQAPEEAAPRADTTRPLPAPAEASGSDIPRVPAFPETGMGTEFVPGSIEQDSGEPLLNPASDMSGINRSRPAP